MKLIEYTYCPPMSTEQKNIVINIISEDGEIEILINGKYPKSITEGHDAIGSIFHDIINLDTWKHSWHINAWDFRNKKVRDRLNEIIIEKQKKRQEELDLLIAAEKLLMMQPVVESTEKNMTVPEQDPYFDLPF